MKVLVVGTGVIGTVHGAHLAAAGNTVSVLSHGPRTDEVAAEAFPPGMSSAVAGPRGNHRSAGRQRELRRRPCRGSE